VSKIYRIRNKITGNTFGGYKTNEWKKKGAAVQALKKLGHRMSQFELVTYEVTETEIEVEDSIQLVAEFNVRLKELEENRNRRQKEYDLNRKKEEIERLEEELEELKK